MNTTAVVPTSKDPSSSRKEQRMVESKMSKKTSSHGDAASWDTDTFNEKVKTSKDGKWKGNETKKATRVQDISMSLASGHEPVPESKNESWPFESSPCRMFGGKNTKGDNDAVNKELFKTEFGGEIKKESKTDSDESEDEQEAEEEDSDVSDSSDDDGDDDDDANSFGEESEREGMEEDKIPEESEDEPPPKQSILKTEKTFKRGPKSKDKSSYKSQSSRSLESTGNLSQESRSSKDRPMIRRSLRRSDSDRRLNKKPASHDPLGGSCHPNIETKNNRRPTKKTSTSLSAATHHGGEPTKSRSRHLSRVKSSDGLEGMRPPPKRGDGLGTSVSFNDGEQGRLRSSKKSDRKTTKSGARRGGLTRAMSTKNVKPPEQNSFRPSGKESEAQREKTVAPVVTPQEQPSKKSSSRPGLERKSSQRSMRIKSDKSSSRSKSSSQSRRSDESDSDGSAGADPEGKRRVKPTRSSSARATPEEPRRDLLVLLREQKTVQPSDLMDKENRRLLHFLAYEHKMGISLKELRRSVSADA